MGARSGFRRQMLRLLSGLVQNLVASCIGSRDRATVRIEYPLDSMLCCDSVVSVTCLSGSNWKLDGQEKEGRDASLSGSSNERYTAVSGERVKRAILYSPS